VPPGCETALLSGRFGDWVYYVRNGRQFRRRYVVPTDRRSPGQLRTRANFARAVKYWSHTAELTEQDRAAWETTANQIQSRPRLQQSGPLTGQQYFVGQACKGKPRLGPTSARQARLRPTSARQARQRPTSARQVADCGMERTARAKTTPQVAQVQCVAPSTPESARHIAVSKGERRPALAGTTRPCRQGCPSTAGLRKGIGGQHRFNVRRRSDAHRVHPACSYGAATVSPRCGLCKGVRNSYLHRSGWWVALWSGMPEAEERGQCRPGPIPASAPPARVRKTLPRQIRPLQPPSGHPEAPQRRFRLEAVLYHNGILALGCRCGATPLPQCFQPKAPLGSRGHAEG